MGPYRLITKGIVWCSASAGSVVLVARRGRRRLRRCPTVAVPLMNQDKFATATPRGLGYRMTDRLPLPTHMPPHLVRNRDVRRASVSIR